MKYCPECAHALIQKECGVDGLVPYCPNCQQFRFPTFNSAISTILCNAQKDKVLLIKQYGKSDNILVAGYINKGENANEALMREVKEEVGIDVRSFTYNDNRYFAKTNTLIHNFIAVAKSEQITLNEEVDSAYWFPLQEAVQYIKKQSLGKYFLIHALHSMGRQDVLLQKEEGHFYFLDHMENIAGEIVFPYVQDHYEITRTFIGEDLRGMGIAAYLMEAVVEEIERRQQKVKPICSYALSWFAKHPQKAHLLTD